MAARRGRGYPGGMRAALLAVLLMAPAVLQGIEALPGDRAAALRERMRGLWEEQAIWTRDWLKDEATRHPGRRAVSGRLLRSYDETGALLAEYFGEEPGRRLSTMLREQAELAADALAAAKRKDKAAMATADGNWRENAGRLADYLAQLNPYWGRDPTRALFDERVTWIQRETAAQVEQDWAADIPAFDGARAHARRLADWLADGIVDQFPERF
jgi:hypothetical protein